MPIVEKFLFDREFGPPRPSEPIFSGDMGNASDEEEKLEITDDLESLVEADKELTETEEELPHSYTELELEKAQTKAYEKGKKDGIAEISEHTEQHISHTLDEIKNKFNDSLLNQEISIREIFEEAIAISIAIPRKLFPTIEKSAALPEIERTVSDILHSIIEEPNLTITVHQKLVKNIEERLNNLIKKSRFDGRIDVNADPEIGLSECRIDWKKGSAARDTQNLQNRINSVIENYLTDNKQRLEASLKPNSTKNANPSDKLEPTSTSSDGAQSDTLSDTTIKTKIINKSSNLEPESLSEPPNLDSIESSSLQINQLSNSENDLDLKEELESTSLAEDNDVNKKKHAAENNSTNEPELIATANNEISSNKNGSTTFIPEHPKIKDINDDKD